MRRVPEPLAWFAALGAPAAWVVQLVLGPEGEEVRCLRAGQRLLGVHTPRWEAGLTAGCAAVAVAALAAAALVVVTLRRRREEGDRRGRILFMGVGALTFAPLFLALILLGGVGSSVLDPCARS